MTFHVDRPTTLEAFQGYDGAFVVDAVDPSGTTSHFRQGAPYLQLKALDGIRTSRLSNPNPHFGGNPWGGNTNNSRFTFKAREIPLGTLWFGFNGVTSPFSTSYPVSSPPTPVPPMRLSGKWKVDRAQIHPLNAIALQKKPLIKIKSITFTGKTSTTVTGKVELSLLGGAMDDSTTLESALSGNGNGMSWGTTVGKTTRDPGRIRVIEWTTFQPTSNDVSIISGRISAANHWPLGFQIEPFNFKKVKVGQALKFTQNPVIFRPVH